MHLELHNTTGSTYRSSDISTLQYSRAVNQATTGEVTHKSLDNRLREHLRSRPNTHSIRSSQNSWKNEKVTLDDSGGSAVDQMNVVPGGVRTKHARKGKQEKRY